MAGERVPDSYKWVALGITTIGVLMAAIDTTVVILALPDIMLELHTSLVGAIWVLMAFILASTVLLLALGRVADIFGRVRLYNLGFVIFTIGSGLCGLARSDYELILWRVVQGIGSALLMVNSLAILTEAFPASQRGTAMGFNSVTFGTGSVLGPILGGLILAVADWRWIFLINVPIGIVGTYFSYRYLRELSPGRGRERLDWVGTTAFSISLLAGLLVLTQSVSLGWTSPFVLGGIVLCAGGFWFFITWERRAECPALDLTLFHSRLYDFSVAAATLQSLALFAVQFLIVFYLQAVRGYSPLDAAFRLLPLPIANAIVGPFGGWISDRVGARLPATTGLLLQAGALYWLSRLTVTTPYLYIAVGLAVMGVGGGLFWSPNTSAAMGTAPTARLGVAAAALATLRNTGMVTSFALALAVAAGSLPRDLMLQLFIGTAMHLGAPIMAAFVHGMNAALRFSVFICLAGAGASLVRGAEQRQNAASQERRAA